LRCGRLKEINETYGHGSGDAVLMHLSALLRSIVRADDRVIRYGGDEFIVICQKAGLDEAIGIGQRVLEAIKKEPLVFEGNTLRYGVSLGVASYPKHSILGRDLVRLADKAMYLAKKSGGNRLRTADSL
jgi:diguanylate cyclase (GGDEF)-like protein